MGSRALTGTGIWSSQLRHGDRGEIAEAVAELDALGYSAVWIGDIGGNLFSALDRLLAPSSTLTVATGVLNVWRHEAPDVAGWWNQLAGEDRARVLLGLGVSHAPLIGVTWQRPLATMSAYLDALDAVGIGSDVRCLAALGPKMLQLARDRTAGAHPYLTTPEHTAEARALLGADRLLAPEQGVVLETDATTARSVARQHLQTYTRLPNYVRNWKRLGFDDHDVETMSDRLVDALIAWGDTGTIARRVAEHREAGADHVCIQVLTEPGAPMPRDAWRLLAPALV
jgi:probable F420-dependent oxidoreductase